MRSARGRYKVHIDIDPSSINKNIHVQVPIVGDVAEVLGEMLALWKERGSKTRAEAVGEVVAADRALARAELPALTGTRTRSSSRSTRCSGSRR